MGDTLRGGLVLLAMFWAWSFFSGDSDDSKASAVAAKKSSTVVRDVSTAEPRRWDDSQICAHAVQVAFYEVMLPRYVDWRGPIHIFQAGDGSRYECFVSNGQAHVTWLNGSSQFKRSDSAQVRIDQQGKLHLKTEMMEMAFE